ncbi:MAG TPA: BON domain-containing protein [Gaiellaceae bacterium]|nr:BON domain-containing protein [Gaiellaceae bacterium]
MKLTDEHVEAAVREELFWDGRLEPREVAVRVHDGVVTLRGTVGSPAQKQAAAEAAKRVKGVARVDDELQVQPMGMHARRDAELRAEVIDVLTHEALLPETLDVRVSNGVVTLRGTVLDSLARDEAQAAVRRVHGVKDVWNELSVEERPIGG